MAGIYTHGDGTPSQYPVTRVHAMTEKTRFYDDGEPCAVCAQRSVRYTHSGGCVHCARLDAVDFFNAVVGMGALTRAIEPTPAMQRAASMLPEHGPAPTSSKAAQQVGADAWVNPEPCPQGHVGIRLLDGSCAVCAHGPRGRWSPRQIALDAGEAWYVPDEPCAQCGERAERSVHNGRCRACTRADRAQSPRQQALDAGRAWYMPDTPCSRCGETALRHVGNGRCQACEPPVRGPSPRQAAIAAGEAWYMPDTPCRHCGQIAERRVANAQCRGCQALARQSDGMPDGMAGQSERAQGVAAMQSQPDMVVSREDARSLGLPAFRTGRACKKGHRGFRYTVSGNCIDCARG